MPQLVLVSVPFLHGIVASRVWNLAAGVISQMTTRGMEALLVVTFAIALVQKACARNCNEPAVHTQILLSASSSWDGEPYQSYPSGQPELSVLKITLAPRTRLEWHSSDAKCCLYRRRKADP